MNQINAVNAPSKYVTQAHLSMVIDGVPLDVALGVDGLVSSLLGWFHFEEESVIPWQRILPEIGCAGYVPVLICPDDLNFSCTVVIAEVIAEPEIIRWPRLGYDASKVGSVGSVISWQAAWGPYSFERSDYEACLSAFRGN